MCVHTSQQSELTFFARKRQRQPLNANRNIFLDSQVGVVLWDQHEEVKQYFNPRTFPSCPFGRIVLASRTTQ